ncbi:MAG: methyl-accepting chemotaxis protein [Anaerolineae bacterium]|nr:methyl-accepting chemotaxis protein [Anaerolineae bacterium]
MKINIQNKLLGAFTVTLVIFATVSAFNYKAQRGSVQAFQEVEDTHHIMELTDTALLNLINMETGFRGYLLSGEDTFLEPYHSGKTEFLEAIAELQTLTSNDPVQLERWAKVDELAKGWEEAWVAKGIDLRQEANAGNADLQAVSDYIATGGGKIYMDNARAVLAEAKQSGVDWLMAAQADNEAAITLMNQITIWGTILAAVVGFVLVFILARSLSGAARQVAYIADGIARGELDHSITVNSNDEMGEMAASFQQMVAYLQEIARAARELAQGNLTVEVKPQSERDVLGNVFQQMIRDLRQLIGQVSANAVNVGTTSAQLSANADQTGQATTQIATTMQQIAYSNAEQADNITRTVSSVEQMRHYIENVAMGAQEQAQAVNLASTVANQISTAIEQVAGNVDSVTNEASNAAQAARTGAKTVDDTVKGIEVIKSKVDLSAIKIQEMGQHSNQIGLIVETIESIASQTNLLALNAAIEAARAGEQGKGFAVVADEVRKLAEKSAEATKDISSLIYAMQQTVADAIQAMDEGTREVESGVVRAQEAGHALATIINAAEKVDRQASEALSATHQMNNSSVELIKAMKRVSNVVEENTATTKEMAASAEEVDQAIKNIVSIGEENSAAVEEVSASTEEMNAQVEDVTSSVQSLAEMAQILTQLIGKFKLLSQQETLPTPSLLPVSQSYQKNLSYTPVASSFVGNTDYIRN